MSLTGAFSTVRLTGSVYLVSTLTGAIKPIPLDLYMARSTTARKLRGWIVRATYEGALSTARKYIRN